MRLNSRSIIQLLKRQRKAQAACHRCDGGVADAEDSMASPTVVMPAKVGWQRPEVSCPGQREEKHAHRQGAQVGERQEADKVLVAGQALVQEAAGDAILKSRLGFRGEQSTLPIKPSREGLHMQPHPETLKRPLQRDNLDARQTVQARPHRTHQQVVCFTLQQIDVVAHLGRALQIGQRPRLFPRLIPLRKLLWPVRQRFTTPMPSWRWAPCRRIARPGRVISQRGHLCPDSNIRLLPKLFCS